MNGGYTAEIKFLVEAAVGVEIAAWVRDHLAADEHGAGAFGDEYHVTSLYFDTAARDVFHRRGSYGRSKYRARRYQNDGVVFLERKLRTSARLAKRRTPVDLAALERLAAAALEPGDPARWFDRRLRLRGLRPVCQVSYLRLARQAALPAGPARLTLDRGITGAAAAGCCFVNGGGADVLPGRMVLEIKYRGSEIPASFEQLVERFQLTPCATSKYRLTAAAVGALGLHV